MSESVLWIIVAVVVILAVAGVLVMVGRNRRHGKAERIREEVGERTAHAERRTALADETAAKARAARAEAEAKVAEAARLEDRADALHGESAGVREDLDAKLEHADKIDPKTKSA